MDEKKILDLALKYKGDSVAFAHAILAAQAESAEPLEKWESNWFATVECRLAEECYVEGDLFASIANLEKRARQQPQSAAIPEGWQKQVEELLGAYWDCAYQEGHLRRPDGTKANQILHELRSLLKLAAPQTQIAQSADVAELVEALKAAQHELETNCLPVLEAHGGFSRKAHFSATYLKIDAALAKHGGKAG